MSADKNQFTQFAKSPGHKWRVLAHDGHKRIELENKGAFDELVVDHWLHLERMDEREWLLALGHDPEVAIWITVKDDGRVAVELKGRDGASSLLVPPE